jgi:hypothetical protein
LPAITDIIRVRGGENVGKQPVWKLLEIVAVISTNDDPEIGGTIRSFELVHLPN